MPAFALVIIGLALPRDPRTRDEVEIDRLILATGCAGLFVTAWVQSLQADASASLYTVLLLLEACLAVALGITARSRVLVVAAASAIAGSAARAVFQAVENVPLYYIFGAAALVMLVLGGGIAIARDRWREFGVVARQAWAAWR